jgi:hypothetical protein
MSRGTGKREPSTPLVEFEKICRENPDQVYIPNAVEISARLDFRLQTKAEVKAFIGNGLEKPEYINTEPWDNNPFKLTHPSDVDAYSFTSGRVTGYIAYCPNTKMNNWRLKSFKKNIVGPGPSINALSEVFASAVLVSELKKEKN